MWSGQADRWPMGWLTKRFDFEGFYVFVSNNVA
jgi:hypothetical protein